MIANSLLPFHPAAKIITPALKNPLVLMGASDRSSVGYRLPGHMWQLNFMRMLKVMANGVVGRKSIFLSDLNAIIQFKPDSCQNNLDLNIHYDISRSQ